MDAPAELRALRALHALTRDGLPYLLALRTVAGETGLGIYASAAAKLSEGLSLTDSLPGLPPPLRCFLRSGERAGRPTEALDVIARAWAEPPHPQLPLQYLAFALGTVTLAELIQDGSDLFDLDPDWKAFAKALRDGGSFAAAAAGKPRILPPPLDTILARSEPSGNLMDVFAAVWEGSQRGMIPYEAAKDRATALKQAFFCWSLLMTAGCPVEDSLVALRPVFQGFEALRADDFVPSLEGAFTPSIRALLKKAYECGGLDRTLRRIAEDLDRGCLPVA